ncbi:Heme utilization protein [Mannheimia varigena USDA-ARS-USMARC-1312]|nr:Heme utilization protein [Mannheimia varigena USDA-ARS-USMARC-1312]
MKIKKYVFHLTCTTLLCPLPKVLAEEGYMLDTVEVKAQAIKKTDEVFIKTGAISTRDKILESNQSLEAIVRSMPGAFTQMDKSQGVVSVNIRGGSGFGRANTVIDGISQTFYGSSTDDGGRSGGTSQFGAFIDPAFLMSVNVERGTFSGSSGANALLGAANFKTIGVNDLVTQGNSVGAMSKMTFGNNAIGPNYMGMLASKYQFNDSAWIGALFGHSWRKISQDYKVGGGRKVTDSSIDLSKINDLDKESSTTSPFNAAHLKQKPISRLAKLEYGDKYQTITLSYRDYQSQVAGRHLKNRNNQLNYRFHLPESPWLDVQVAYAENQGKQNYNKGSRVNNKYLIQGLAINNKATTLDLNNTFKMSPFKDGEWEATLGFNRLKNRYSKNRHPAELNYNLENGETNENNDSVGMTAVRKSLYTSTFQPDGEQKFDIFYLDNHFNYGIWGLDINANINTARFIGQRFKYFPFTIEELESNIREANRNRQFEHLKSLQSQLDNLRKKHCTYIPDEDFPNDPEWGEFNCPDVNIPHTATGKHKRINYSATLSAYIHDLFTPFISYSQTHRAPNIKEIFFSNLGDYGVNTALQPEQAKTTQFGINGLKEGVFSEKDKLGFKVLFYNTHLKNYIYNIQHTAVGSAPGLFIFHKNYEKPVNTKGIELEFSYDIGSFYANLAYARQNTNQPVSFTDASSRVDASSAYGFKTQGFGSSKISALPRDYGSLELGTRWLDQKLQIGGMVKYYGKSKRIAIDEFNYTYYPGTYIVKETHRLEETVNKQPMIVDFYVSYEPIKSLILKLELQNAFDKKYIDPLDANNDAASQRVYNSDISDEPIYTLNNYARGRTVVFSTSYKF